MGCFLIIDLLRDQISLGNHDQVLRTSFWKLDDGMRNILGNFRGTRHVVYRVRSMISDLISFFHRVRLTAWAAFRFPVGQTGNTHYIECLPILPLPLSRPRLRCINPLDSRAVRQSLRRCVRLRRAVTSLEACEASGKLIAKHDAPAYSVGCRLLQI